MKFNQSWARVGMRTRFPVHTQGLHQRLCIDHCAHGPHKWEAFGSRETFYCRGFTFDRT